MKDIILVGYGGHGKSVEDAIYSMDEYNLVGYTDLKKHEDCYLPYLGNDDILEDLFATGICNAAIGLGFMGNNNFRDKLYNQLISIGYNLPPIIDSSAVISKSSKISSGTFIGKRTVINAYSSIGKMTIINTGSIIEHGCKVDDYSHIAVGAVLCGNVKVKDHTFIGANSTIMQGITIDSYSIIGAGTLIIENVEKGSTVVGVPGRRIK